MQVTKDATILDIIKAYPYMLDWFAHYAPEFEKLRNPVLRNTVARAATLEAAAVLADKPADKFLDDVRTEIAKQEIVAEETAAADGGSGAGSSGTSDVERQEALKAIIRKLHDGAAPEEVKVEFDALTQQVDSAEIARMEQALIAEGMPVEEVQRLCDVHVTVFKDSLEKSAAEADVPDLPDWHPVVAYLNENRELDSVLASATKALDTATSADEGASRDAALTDLAAALDDLSHIDIHYLRAENQLFPVLETHGVEGPTKVMWGLHDDIRAQLKEATALASAGDVGVLAEKLPETLRMIEDMVYKEEKILFPTALDVILADEWEQIAHGDAEIGYAWIEPPERVEGEIVQTASTPASGPAEGLSSLLQLTTGALSLEQMDLLFRSIPFDITYVDEEDRVRFYSEGERVFPRSSAVIGREVRNCHPPASVDKVEQILSEFKAGSKSTAEFWIEFQDRFIHIRYFALRDAEEKYCGCLEVVQDATHVRSLEGQRRITDW